MTDAEVAELAALRATRGVTTTIFPDRSSVAYDASIREKRLLQLEAMEATAAGRPQVRRVLPWVQRGLC